MSQTIDDKKEERLVIYVGTDWLFKCTNKERERVMPGNKPFILFLSFLLAFLLSSHTMMRISLTKYGTMRREQYLGTV